MFLDQESNKKPNQCNIFFWAAKVGLASGYEAKIPVFSTSRKAKKMFKQTVIYYVLLMPTCKQTLCHILWNGRKLCLYNTCISYVFDSVFCQCFVFSWWASLTVFSSRNQHHQLLVGLTFCQRFISMSKTFLLSFIRERLSYVYVSMCRVYTYIYICICICTCICISCQCQYHTNCAGHFTLDAHASRPVACYVETIGVEKMIITGNSGAGSRRFLFPLALLQTNSCDLGTTWRGRLHAKR